MTCLVDKLILNLHLLAKLSPDLPQGQFVIGVNKAVESNNVELAFVLLRHVAYDRLNQLRQN